MANDRMFMFKCVIFTPKKRLPLVELPIEEQADELKRRWKILQLPVSHDRSIQQTLVASIDDQWLPIGVAGFRETDVIKARNLGAS